MGRSLTAPASSSHLSISTAPVHLDAAPHPPTTRQADPCWTPACAGRHAFDPYKDAPRIVDFTGAARALFTRPTTKSEPLPTVKELLATGEQLDRWLLYTVLIPGVCLGLVMTILAVLAGVL